MLFRTAILLFSYCLDHTLDVLTVRSQLLSFVLRVGHDMVEPLDAEHESVPEAHTLPNVEPIVPELKFLRE